MSGKLSNTDGYWLFFCSSPQWGIGVIAYCLWAKEQFTSLFLIHAYITFHTTTISWISLSLFIHLMSLWLKPYLRPPPHCSPIRMQVFTLAPPFQPGHSWRIITSNWNPMVVLELTRGCPGVNRWKAWGVSANSKRDSGKLKRKKLNHIFPAEKKILFCYLFLGATIKQRKKSLMTDTT